MWKFVFLATFGSPLACVSSDIGNSGEPGAEVPSCSAGYSECGGTCTDLLGDGQNCGSCGTSCSQDQVCSAGACQGGSCTEPGRTQCESSCVDVQTNPIHCGGCGVLCDNGQACQGGICVAGIEVGSGGNTGDGGSAGTGGTSGSYSTEVVLEEGETGQCAVEGVLESTHSGFTGAGYLNSDNVLGA